MKAESSQVRVLLVEDSRILTEQILELLQSVACAGAVNVVDSEKDAIAATAEYAPDLLILDLHLRHGTGFGVLKALRASKYSPVVIVLTNYALPQYREQALALGAHYFLDKASDFDRLPALIKHVNETHLTRDESPLS